MADAAATFLVNKTNVGSTKIIRERADVIYPDTDIAGLKVTVFVGDITTSQIKKALNNGRKEAQNLTKRKLIRGAVLSVKGNRSDLGYFKEKLIKMKQPSKTI